MTRTYVDANVLILGARGAGEPRERALAILSNPDRSFCSSPFLELEVVPLAAYHKQALESAFYLEYFQAAEPCIDLTGVVDIAAREAALCGLHAMDALHLAAAYITGCDELITAEKRTKPIYRSKLVRVVYLTEVGS